MCTNIWPKKLILSLISYCSSSTEIIALHVFWLKTMEKSDPKTTTLRSWMSRIFRQHSLQENNNFRALIKNQLSITVKKNTKQWKDVLDNIDLVENEDFGGHQTLFSTRRKEYKQKVLLKCSTNVLLHVWSNKIAPAKLQISFTKLIN